MNLGLYIVNALTTMGLTEADAALSVVGGYALLVILVPLLILFLVILAFVNMVTMASVSDKLSKIADILEAGLDVVPVDAIEEESVSGREASPQDADQSKKGASLTAFGIVLGVVLLAIGYVAQDDLWSKVLFVAGGASIVISIVIPISESISRTDKNGLLEPAEEHSEPDPNSSL